MKNLGVGRGMIVFLNRKEGPNYSCPNFGPHGHLMQKTAAVKKKGQA